MAIQTKYNYSCSPYSTHPFLPLFPPLYLSLLHTWQICVFAAHETEIEYEKWTNAATPAAGNNNNKRNIKCLKAVAGARIKLHTEGGRGGSK